MLQLRVSANRGAIENCVAHDFPFVIGRSPNTNLRLEAPGVWDFHAAINLDRASKKFIISRQGNSLLLVNGERVDTKILLIGDQLQIGAAEISVMLSNADQARLAPIETCLWLLLSAVLLFEASLFFYLR